MLRAATLAFVLMTTVAATSMADGGFFSSRRWCHRYLTSKL